MKELQAIVAALLAPTADTSVLATLVNVEGSSYRRPGARLLMTSDGRRIGSISGGCLEEDVMARAVRVRESGVPDAVVYDTTSENDLVWGVGLGCHGVVRVFLERIEPRPAWAGALARNFTRRRPTALAVLHGVDDRAASGTRLAAPGDCADPERLFLDLVAPPPALTIFGAGDDAIPLARLARELGWHITVADPRAAFATKARFPHADALVVGAADALVGNVYGPTHSSSQSPVEGPALSPVEGIAVVMTHHYVHDVPILRELLARPLAYLGLLGPKKRAEKVLADLEAGGASIPPEQRARLHAPVGLDLGAETPEQVALAIVAEIQAVLSHRDARPLRDRARPIHEKGFAAQVFAAQKP